jgi:protein O-mannosyl-transferase
MPDSRKRKVALKNRAATQSFSRADGQPVIAGIVCTLLAAIVFLVFGQTVRHEFINFDDQEYVYENPRITSGLSLDGIRWAFTHVHAGNWHPLTSISHQLDSQLYGLQPWGHHLTNVLLHAAAAVFLFLALWQLTGALWPSGFVAAVFAIHPLRVESVAWVAERKDVLSGVFFMLTLWAYARYVRSNRPSSGRYMIALVLFALGLMCKPTLVTLPFVLLLLDYWPLRRVAVKSSTLKTRCSAREYPASHRGENSSGRTPLPKKLLGYLLVEKVPFFVLSAASCVATLLAQERALIALHQLTFGDRLANALVSYVAYLGQMIWPAGFAVVYPYPQGGWNIVQTILAFLVLMIISVVFFVWRVRYPFLLVGWLWFLGMLAPIIGIVQVGTQARADRYTYLSQIGLYLLVTWGAMALCVKWRRSRDVLIAIALLIVTGLMAESYFQTSFWRDSETLWNQTLDHTSNNYIAYNNLGRAVMQKGRLDEAVDHFRKAIEISDYPAAHHNLGYASAHYNLGYALARKGNWADAIVSFQTAIRVRPNYSEAHSNLAFSLSKLGRTDEALAEFREALRLDDNYQDHRNLAILLLQLGRRDEAVTHFREVLRLKPDDTVARDQLHQLGAER